MTSPDPSHWLGFNLSVHHPASDGMVLFPLHQLSDLTTVPLLTYYSSLLLIVISGAMSAVQRLSAVCKQK